MSFHFIFIRLIFRHFLKGGGGGGVITIEVKRHMLWPEQALALSYLDGVFGRKSELFECFGRPLAPINVLRRHVQSSTLRTK